MADSGWMVEKGIGRAPGGSRSSDDLGQTRYEAGGTVSLTVQEIAKTIRKVLDW